MRWELVVLVIVSSVGLMSVLGWVLLRQRPAAPTAAPIQAPPPPIDPAPQIAAAQQTLALLQQAAAALFGTEYLAASQVAAWQITYPDVCARAADPTWRRWLPPDLVALAEHARHPFLDLPRAVADHNAFVLRQRLHDESAAFDRVERFPLTQRQREAIVTDEDTTLVIAGAGTGKTSTIVGKVDYLIRRKLAAPDEILVLAYGKKAQEELQARLQVLGHGTGVTISTFHALGFTIHKAATRQMIQVSRLTDDPTRHAFLQACVTDLWGDAVLHPILRDFFTSMLEEAADRPATFRTLTGEVLRSAQEVQIATWLTLHGIRWDYERPYPIDTTADGRRQYRPDFYLPDHDLYLEHFGIDRQGRTRADIDARQYQAAMIWKRELHRTHGTRLIETYSYMATEGGLPHYLAQILPAAGVPCTLLPPDALTALLGAPSTPGLPPGGRGPPATSRCGCPASAPAHSHPAICCQHPSPGAHRWQAPCGSNQSPAHGALRRGGHQTRRGSLLERCPAQPKRPGSRRRPPARSASAGSRPGPPPALISVAATAAPTQVPRPADGHRARESHPYSPPLHERTTRASQEQAPCEWCFDTLAAAGVSLFKEPPHG